MLMKQNVSSGRCGRERKSVTIHFLHAPGRSHATTSPSTPFIIGTGQAGPPLAARLSHAGKKVAVIERGKFGGLASTTAASRPRRSWPARYAAHLARRASEYGVDIGGPVRSDMKRVKARKDEIPARVQSGVERWMRGLANATVFRVMPASSDRMPCR
jgi:pyruvate/2-oxoglutarate dehydrogenase complex dihydrolipoamide dehydrogenase (E3) component